MADSKNTFSLSQKCFWIDKLKPQHVPGWCEFLTVLQRLLRADTSLSMCSDSTVLWNEKRFVDTITTLSLFNQHLSGPFLHRPSSAKPVLPNGRSPGVLWLKNFLAHESHSCKWLKIIHRAVLSLLSNRIEKSTKNDLRMRMRLLIHLGGLSK